MTVKIPPYGLELYIKEADETHVEDYVVLAHSRYGVNSCALQYYLAHGALEMFLHLGWGSAYINTEGSALKICDCLSLADKIVQTAEKFKRGIRLRVVCSDFHGSYWSAGGILEEVS